MKKIIVLLIAFCTIFSAFAYDFEASGIYYNITSYAEPYTVAVTFKTQYGAIYTGAVTIPASVSYNKTTYAVTSIGNYAFYDCSKLTSITLPSSIRKIESNAFVLCRGLTDITLPNSLLTIGGSAFWGCSNLTSITIPALVTIIDDSAFYGCSNLVGVNLSNSLLTIGRQAFVNCNKLESINLPNSVESIGEQAFYGCNSIISFSVGAESSAFSSLDGVLFNNTKTILVRYPSGKKEITYIIPNSVTSINNAFTGCSNLTSVDLPNSLTNINGAFAGCSKLKSITLPNTIKSIGDYTFSQCNMLTNIDLPVGLTTIGEQSFYNCNSLTSITLPNTVVKVGIQAFGKCYELNDVYLSNSIKTIESSTFSECSSLSNITLPSSLLNIDNYAFSKCNSLTELKLPASVKSIGNNAFNESGLKKIILPDSLKTIGEYALPYSLTNIQIPIPIPPAVNSKAFASVNKKNCLLEVPINSKVLYQQADVWKEFVNINEIDFLNSTTEFEADDLKIFTVDGKLRIEGLEYGKSVQLFNISGKLLFNDILSDNIIEFQGLRKGIYLIKIEGTIEKVVL